MKAILTFSVVLLCLGSLAAQGEFVSLFDGKSLEGWRSSSDSPGCFTVEGGALKVSGGRAHLFYAGDVGNADFGNFELKLKAKTTKGSNSGVYFHTKFQDEGWPSAGFEAQVNSTHTDPKKTGSLYGIANVFVPKEGEPYGVKISAKKEIFLHAPQAPSTDDEWFDYHITVMDSRVVIRVNGKITVDWTQPADWQREDRRIGSGTFALQAHDPKSTTYFKDISVKIL